MARILVVDDEAPLRRALRRTLEQAGHEVIEAENGLVALKLHHASPADVVITDILMPERDGIEVIVALRLESPEVKIIAISGGGRFHQSEVLDIAEPLGAFATVQKPFDGREILDVVTRAVTAGADAKGC
jgi:DNA-binding NtrC family response regulator